MNKLTRRRFGKQILAASALPLLKTSLPEPQTANSGSSPGIPDVIAGYTLKAEDKQLAAKFLSTHEKNVSALRETELPNSLAPCFNFSNPQLSGEPSSR